MKNTPAVELWSAAPTPLTPALEVDVASVERMVRDAVANGMTGLFLCGTCGEGPWLPDRERRRLVKAASAAAGGDLQIAVQVTDNSVPRIIDNIHRAAEDGAQIAIIAAPATVLNGTPERIAAHFAGAANASPLPVGIYDLGNHRPVVIPADRLKEIYLLPRVHLVKDSSGSPERRALALAARELKPSLKLFNGDEFRCLEYLEAGYDGMLFGGAAAAAPWLRRIVECFTSGDIDGAWQVESEMREVLFGIYGGRTIACWLTGLKYFLVRRGVFSSASSFLGYPLTEECRQFIERHAAKA